MKGWVGVARLKMSPGRIPSLSNSRRGTKRPLTGAITDPCHHRASSLCSCCCMVHSQPADVAAECCNSPFKWRKDKSHRGWKKESLGNSWDNLYTSLFKEFLSFQRPHGTPICSLTGSLFWQNFFPLHLCLVVQVFISFWATQRKASYNVLMKTNNKQEI